MVLTAKVLKFSVNGTDASPTQNSEPLSKVSSYSFYNSSPRKVFNLSGQTNPVRIYDVHLGYIEDSILVSTPILHNDVVPLEFNPRDFDGDNEIRKDNFVTLSGNIARLCSVNQLLTSNTKMKYDLIIATTGTSQAGVDLVIKRTKVGQETTEIISEEIAASADYYCMGAVPVFRGGFSANKQQLIAYDHFFMFLD